MTTDDTAPTGELELARAEPPRTVLGASPGLRLLVTAAFVQVALGIVGFALDPGGGRAGSAFPPWLHLLTVLAFGGGGVLLLTAGRVHRAAVFLGGTLLLRSTDFALRYVGGIGTALPEAASMASLVASLRLSAFEPALLWLFVDEFPSVQSFGAYASLARRMARVSFVVGGSVAALGLVGAVWGGLPIHVVRLSWLVTLLLVLPAVPFGFWKAGRASTEQRFRAKVFLGAILVGLLPLTLSALAFGLVPAYRRFLGQGQNLYLSGFVVYPFFLTIPFTTAWAVLVERVLDARLGIRIALQYALARYTLLVLFALPLSGLVAFAVVHGDRTLADLVVDPGFVVLALAASVGLLLLVVRRELSEWLDRRFFREEYDARRLLSALVTRCRQASSVRDLADLLVLEIDGALHLSSLTLFLQDRVTARLVARGGAGRALSAGSALAVLVAGSAEPLVVDLDGKSSPLRRLPEGDRHWLADGGYRLLVPLLGSDGNLVGILALGDKRSEMPFSREDQTLLCTIAAHASLAIESRDRSAGLTPSPVSWSSGKVVEVQAGGECARCGTVFPSGTSRCASCGDGLFACPLPSVLLGKFVLERRIGSGGMGVVYRGVDLVLGRPVAVKTLPRMAPEGAARLRREARANAALTHPNLATIFGAETWNGVPVLVFELLDGGTLADRLRKGPLPVRQVLEIGVCLADGLDRAHDAGVLHRDIKPSNVGFTAEGVPKLLDFGLSRLVEDRRKEAGGELRPTCGASSGTQSIGEGTRAGVVVGTPGYVPPEALAGASPGPHFDLWGLSVTLFEALVGENPFAGESLDETLRLVTEGRVPALCTRRPECPPSLETFFAMALARDPRHRFGSARALRERLRVELQGA